MRGADGMRRAWRARVPDEIGTPPGSRRLALPVWPFLLTAGIALALSVVIQPSWIGVSLAAGVCLPALLARHRPLAAVASCVVVNMMLALGYARLPDELVSAPWFLNVAPPQLAAAYTAGLALPAVAAGGAIGAIAVSVVPFVLARGIPGIPAELLALSATLAVAALLGARQRDRHVRTLRRIADAEQRRVQDERDRIARELHDVVAHHMSVLAVRAVSASRRIPDLPDAAIDEFRDLGSAARESLGELRQLLGALHGDAEPELTTQPGLDDLRRLAERTSGAGTPVELTIDAPPRVPAATAVSAYRIVQEALSNVTRHATGARTHVGVQPDADGAQLVVKVTNEHPPTLPASQTTGTGHGLAGMRERVRLLGGRFAAGPTPSGGFAVRAELPLRRLS